jgi:hypothetical protein
LEQLGWRFCGKVAEEKRDGEYIVRNFYPIIFVHVGIGTE